MVDNKEEQKRRNEFKKLLNELSQRKFVDSVRVYEDLGYIYRGKNNKRIELQHYYSDAFSVLISIKDSKERTENLCSNLNEVYELSQRRADKELIVCIRNLLDYTNLEIDRIKFLLSLEDRKNTPEKINNSLKKIGKRVEEQENNIKKLTKYTNSAYSSFISILGIFSAIVMVFFGGTTIFANAIGHIGDTPVDKLVLVCTLCGLLVSNIIFIFLYFLSKLLDRSISATMEPVYWLKISVRFRLRYPMVFYINLLGCIVMLVSGIFVAGRKVLSLMFHDETIYTFLCGYIYNWFLNYKISFVILMILMIFDGLFAIAYTIAKITDRNIGCILCLRNKNPYWWTYEEGKYVVYNVGMITKEFDEENDMIKYFRQKNSCYNIKAYICNFCKRVFLRYPYLSFINILMLLLLVRSI